MSESIPKSGEYADGKYWYQRKGALVTIGLTDSAIEELGEIESIELPDEGEDFSKDEVIVTVEGSNATLEVPVPAGGIVQAVNVAAQDQPDMVSEDPLEEGWLVKIEVEDPTELLKEL